MKNPTYKRFFAYILDIIIITMIAALFSDIRLINPYYDEYENSTQEYLEIFSSQIDNIVGGNVTNVTVDVDNYEDQINEIAYNISYYGYYIFIISLVVKLLYFVVFAYYNDGKTIGKALLKIKVKSNSNKKLRLIDLLIRSAIGYGLIFDLINILLLKACDMNQYLSINSKINGVETIIVSAIVIMILFRKDSRGLHDFAAGTKVISLKEGETKNENRDS